MYRRDAIRSPASGILTMQILMQMRMRFTGYQMHLKTLYEKYERWLVVSPPFYFSLLKTFGGPNRRARSLKVDRSQNHDVIKMLAGPELTLLALLLSRLD